MSRGRNRNSGGTDEDEWDNDGSWDSTPRGRGRSRDRYDDDEDDRPSRRRRYNRRSSSDDSTTPFVLSLIGWFICPILSVIAFILAINQMNDARSRGDSAPGLAVAALVISGLHLMLLAMVLAFVFVVH